MFTGCIESTGKLLSRSKIADGEKIVISTPWGNEAKPGQSIAVNGACLTVDAINHNDNSFEFHTLSETLEKTNLDSVAIGAVVNLERALRVGDRLDGHFVTGHIDYSGKILDVAKCSNDIVIEIELKAEFAGQIVAKGSIAVDGISLTVVDVNNSSFTVHIIPFTFNNTNLKEAIAGSLVNLEMDLIGKYIVRSQILNES